VKADNLLSSGLWLTVGLVAAAFAWRLDLGAVSQPGPGFFPFWSAVMLSSLATILALLNLNGFREWEQRSRLTDMFNGPRVVCLLAVAAYIATLPLLGFASGSFLLLLVLTGIIGQSAWHSRLLFSLASVSLFWAIFELFLRLDLPASQLLKSFRG
jgi:hypothetical protein